LAQEILLKMRVLYLHPAAAYGGASKSLIELYQQLRAAGVSATVLTPRGSASAAFARVGMEVLHVKGLSQFDNTRFGHYRRLRWLILLRELYLAPFSLLALWRLRDQRFDLIHANEITLLPFALLAKRWFKLPLVVHVRSLQRDPHAGLRSRWMTDVLRTQVDAVVAIDHTVANSLAPEVPRTIVHNGLNLGTDVPLAADPRGPNSKPSVALIGVLIRFKGVYEFLEAARILVRERGVGAEFLIAGENARAQSGLKSKLLKLMGFSEDVESELARRIEEFGLHEHVHLLGFVSDIRSLYPRVDVLCFPSHLDAAGRPVFEAACFGIPSVVAIANPEPDAVVDGVTGLAICRPDPILLADALEKLIIDTPYRQQLGRQAQLWAAEHFSIAANARLVSDLYQRLVNASVERQG